MEDSYFALSDVHPTAPKKPSAAEGGAPPQSSSASAAGTNPSMDPAYDAVRNPMVAAALAASSSSASSPPSSDNPRGGGGASSGGNPTEEPPHPPSSGCDKPPPPSRPAPVESSSSDATSTLAHDANEELAVLLQAGKISQSDVTSLQRVVRENATLREKVAKLKSLLGRSAKAQKECKAELDVARVRLDEAHREAERLRSKVESLAARPTHMDLLADFETNFDRALLSIGTGGEQQKSGEDSHPGAAREKGDPSADGGSPPAAAALDSPAAAAADGAEEGVVSTMLLTELSDAKSRIERLESLNSALLHRASKLERSNEKLADERDDAVSRMTNLQLELRMAKMETENASRAAREKDSSLAEMQMEIDLVTKSAMDANVRAAEGMAAAETVSADKAYVDELEAKVSALQEWALASAESKSIVQERCKVLEAKLRDLTETADEDGEGGCGGKGLLSMDDSQRGSAEGATAGGGGGAGPPPERRLWTKQANLVVGAGMVGGRTVDLGPVQVHANESVVLRWKFDLTPAEVDILFSILKGRWEYNSAAKLKDADALFRDRLVKGGGAGEVTGAFAVQGACTLVWNNSKSWVRPKTIKYTVEAYAVM